ncbi:MAG: 50S ribosomal protein L21e [Candidatus Micrarchaeota archaeon]
MVKASKGPLNRQTRKLKGKSVASVAQQVRTFNMGDRVVITPRSTHRGLPHLRYSGRNGTIIEKRGKSYMVEVPDLKSKKTVIVGAVHLTLAK